MILSSRYLSTLMALLGTCLQAHGAIIPQARSPEFNGLTIGIPVHSFVLPVGAPNQKIIRPTVGGDGVEIDLFLSDGKEHQVDFNIFWYKTKAKKAGDPDPQWDTDISHWDVSDPNSPHTAIYKPYETVKCTAKGTKDFKNSQMIEMLPRNGLFMPSVDGIQGLTFKCDVVASQ